MFLKFRLFEIAIVYEFLYFELLGIEYKNYDGAFLYVEYDCELGEFKFDFLFLRFLWLKYREWRESRE